MKFNIIYETILNSMSETVYVVDREMRIQYVNRAAGKLTGYSPDESVGKFCHDIFCEESYRCKDLCPPKQAMEKMSPILHREAETKTKNGDVRQTQISISPLCDEDVCTGAVIVVQDITELKKADERIRRQNTFLTAVIDALPHPFLVIDADTHSLKLANVAAYHGKLPEQMTCHELSHKTSVPCSSMDHPCPLEKVKSTGQPVMLEHKHYDANGILRDVEVHGFPIFDDEGKVVKMIEYSIDISDRNRVARERETLIVDLQKALQKVKTLSGLLPICSSCKKIRDDTGYWNILEQYISEHSDAEFTHGLCPECVRRLYPNLKLNESR
ncbi:MAG: PAS domain-containing protein [Gallionella sp.]